jgi:hypothetical protein
MKAKNVIANVYNTVYAKDIGPSDLTDVQCLCSDGSVFTPDQNVQCHHVRFKSFLLYMYIKYIKEIQLCLWTWLYNSMD